MSLLDRITIEPGKCGGRPCIRGMRIRVKDVLEMLAARVPEKEILEDFPYLEPADIDACLQYAACKATTPSSRALSTLRDGAACDAGVLPAL